MDRREAVPFVTASQANEEKRLIILQVSLRVKHREVRQWRQMAAMPGVRRKHIKKQAQAYDLYGNPFVFAEEEGHQDGYGKSDGGGYEPEVGVIDERCAGRGEDLAREA